MRKFWLLVKIQLLGLFGINKLAYSKDKKDRQQTLVGLSMWTVGFIVLMLYSALISVAWASLGEARSIPVLTMTAASIIIIMFTFFGINGLLFGFKDADMVFSLPVKTSTVILSRLAQSYVINFLFGFAAVMPSAIVYGAYMKPSVAVHLMQLAALFILPILPMLAAAVVGTLITALSVRFKYKNLASILFSMGALLAVVFLSFQLQTEQIILNIGFAIEETMIKRYPPAFFYAAAIADENWLYLAAFAAISIACLALFVAVLTKFYGKINSMFTARVSNGGYKIKDLSAQTPFVALYKREMKRLLSCSFYVLNTCFGMAMLAALAVMSFFIDMNDILSQMEVAGGVSDYVKYLPFVIAMFAALSSTTASAISMEGKSRWIMFSLPVTPKMLYMSKIAVNLTVICPVSAFAAVMFAIAFHISFAQTLLMLAFPLAFAAFIAEAGLLLNIAFPKYDWQSEYYVVKNSIPVLIITFAGILLAIGLILGNFLFAKYSNVYQIACVFVILFADYVLYKIIKDIRLFM